MKKIKKFIKIRLAILKASIIYTFQIDTAYWWNNWGNLVSTFSFVAMQLLFLEVIYSNVDLIAGYSRDEMLFFFVISQVWFYIIHAIYFKNITDMISDVLSGGLDLILTKPVPALFYITTKRINVYQTFRDGLLPMLIVIVPINWNNIDISIFNLALGILIFLTGIYISGILYFLGASTSFWWGDSRDLLGMILYLEDKSGHQFPLEGWGKTFQIIFTVIFPSLVATAISTSVMLGRSNGLIMLALSIIIAVNFKFIQNFVWDKALKQYSSASS